MTSTSNASTDPDDPSTTGKTAACGHKSAHTGRPPTDSAGARVSAMFGRALFRVSDAVPPGLMRTA
jgi:hypothetical protein